MERKFVLEPKSPCRQNSGGLRQRGGWVLSLPPIGVWRARTSLGPLEGSWETLCVPGLHVWTVASRYYPRLASIQAECRQDFCPAEPLFRTHLGRGE
jgi:hypothetical protein